MFDQTNKNRQNDVEIYQKINNFNNILENFNQQVFLKVKVFQRSTD